MSTAIYLLLACFSIICYCKKDYSRFLVFLSIIIYKGFGFLPLIFSADSKNNDFVLIVILGIILIQFIKGRNLLSTCNDSIAKIIVLILIYQFIVVILSGFNHVDSWVNVLGQYRFCLVWLLYFILRPISLGVYVHLLPSLIKIMILVIICYVGVEILQVTEVNYFKQPIFALVPPLLFCFVLESLPLMSNKKIIILFFCIGIFFLYARILLLAIILSFCYYLIKIKKGKKFLLPMAILCILAPIAITQLDNAKATSHKSNSLSEEIAMIKDAQDYSDFRSSSGVLRFMSIYERIEYMIEHPKQLLCGIGAMKEITAQDKMSFTSGTFGTLEADGNRVVLQLDTDDVGLLSSFMRYGLIYILLFSMLCHRSFRRFKFYFNHPYMKTGYLTLLMMLLAIPGTNFFFYEWTLFPLILLLSLSNYFINVRKK